MHIQNSRADNLLKFSMLCTGSAITAGTAVTPSYDTAPARLKYLFLFLEQTEKNGEINLQFMRKKCELQCIYFRLFFVPAVEEQNFY